MSVDYSAVPPLGAYPATKCPVRLQYDRLPPEGTVSTPPAPSDQARMDEGREHEANILARLAQLHPDAVDAGGERRTIEAMNGGAPLILRARLPEDLAECRTGHPDVLLRVEGGYVPVDVKLHNLTTAGKGDVQVSELSDPWRSSEMPECTIRSAREHDNALQLAHYWRMLERLGFAADGHARGGIIDRSEQLWWIPLDEPRDRVWWLEDKATWLERYDHEFAFRRDVAAHVERRKAGEDLSPKVEPVWVSECRSCPWQDVCRSELEAVDHVSLLPATTWKQHLEHRRRDVNTRARLAALDTFTANLLPRLTATAWRRIEDAPDDAVLTELGIRNREAVLAELSAKGVLTAGQLRARLDPTTYSYRDSSISSLLERIDLARAALTGPMRRRGAGPLNLPVAAVEVDLDMECDQEGRAYLWGALPVVAGGVRDYVAIDSYDELTDEVEGRLLVELLDWLEERRREAAGLGGELRVYHWSPAELSAMRRVVKKAAVPGLPTLAELDAMFAREFVDLMEVWRAVVITGDGASIKTVAPIVGFEWDVDDPGGDFSMLQHHTAVTEGGDDRSAAIDWLRSYNRSDVVATYAVRDWLRERYESLPRVEQWTPDEAVVRHPYV